MLYNIIRNILFAVIIMINYEVIQEISIVYSARHSDTNIKI